MPTVPQYNREVKLNGAAKPYINLDINGDMFGANVAKASMNIAGSAAHAVDNALSILQTVDDAKLLELSNNIDKWKQDNLYDKENGYFVKSGKDAAGKSDEVMKGYDDFIEEYKANNQVSGFSQRRMDSVITKKRNRIQQGVNNHDVEQTKKWAEAEGQTAMNNAITGMVHARNNPDEMKTCMNNGLLALQWSAETQKLDEPTTELMRQGYKSNAHEAVLNAYLEEGSLKAKGYFDEHKDEIDPKKQARYIGAIRENEIRYEARNNASRLVALPDDKAYKEINNIKDIDKRNATEREYYRLKRQNEELKDEQRKRALNDFYTKAVNVLQNGGTLSYDDIPNSIDPQDKLSLMNFVSKNGQPETDNHIWETLYNMSVNNAQGFAKEDLNKYRGFISEGDFKSLIKRQQDIKNGTYYTQIKDDNQMIQDALKSVGLDKNSIIPGKADKRDIAYSEIKSAVRELEARKGRSVTNDELLNITKSLGYKDKNGVELYKQIEKGMREKVGFMKDVMNDFTYYQSQHNGQLPSDEEKMKIVNRRIANYSQNQNNGLEQALEYNIQHTTPRTNEQKNLSYLADRAIPKMGKELGLKLNVTSRYRNQTGSHHKEGRALDVSMSEHSTNNRIRIVEKLLKDYPDVEAIGTSDPNILSHFNGNKKIVDERKYDKQHGTNHVNHIHVTLKSEMTKIKAPNGRIYNVPYSKVSEAKKNGGVVVN